MEVYFINPVDVLMRRIKPLGYFVHPGGWGFNLLFFGFNVNRK